MFLFFLSYNCRPHSREVSVCISIRLSVWFCETYSGQKKKLSAPKQVQNFPKMIRGCPPGMWTPPFPTLIGKKFILLVSGRRVSFFWALYIVHQPNGIQYIWATLWTAELYCVPLRFCTNIHFVRAQCSFVLIRWCTRRFFMYVMPHDLDGAQCGVVSLAGYLVKLRAAVDLFRPMAISMAFLSLHWLSFFFSFSFSFIRTPMNSCFNLKSEPVDLPSNGGL